MVSAAERAQRHAVPGVAGRRHHGLDGREVDVERGHVGGALVGAGAGLIGLSGLGVIAVGLAPEDANPAIHYFGAAENLIFCNLGMLALGLAMSVSQGASRLIARAGVAAGVIGLAGLACLASGHYAGIGPGGVERVAAYPFPLWLSATGAWILTARRA